jgi:hypothetical protein
MKREQLIGEIGRLKLKGSCLLNVRWRRKLLKKGRIIPFCIFILIMVNGNVKNFVHRKFDR